MVFHGGTKNGKEENQKESNKEKSQEEKEIAARLTCAQHESRHFLAAFFFGTGSYLCDIIQAESATFMLKYSGGSFF